MFLICGEALFDFFSAPGAAPEDGSLLFRGVTGGSPFNVAIGLARLGCTAALATELFDDRLGERLEATLAREGVDLSFVRRSRGATPIALVEIDAGGVPHYAFHGLREMRTDPELSSLDEFSGIHVGSVPIVSERSSGPLLELVSRPAWGLVSFDPNVRLAVEPDTRLWRDQIDRFRLHAHLIKVSIEDLQAIHGDDVDAAQLAASWLGGATRLVVLTRGHEGATLYSAGCEPIEIAAAPTNVIDTVGAGDSFMAALLCRLVECGSVGASELSRLSTEQLRALGEFAAQAASLTCSRRGPDLPRRAELPHR